MIKRSILNRYFARQYAFWLIAFLLGLTGIIFLFEVAELLRRASDRPDTTFWLILKMGVLKLPETVERVLPFVVLFSGMFTFWRLTRSQELIITRASGVSAWEFLLPALIITALFGFFNVVVLNPINARMNGFYKDMEMRYLKGVSQFELTGTGLWLRQQDGNQRYLLHADKVTMNPLTLQPVIIFFYDTQNRYIGRIDAPTATLGNKTWNIANAWVNWDQKPVEHADTYTVPTDLTIDTIQDSMAAPNTISFWALPGFINALKAIGLPATRHELQMQTLLSQPILLCAMVFFAAAFSLQLNRRGKIINVIIAGATVGIAVYSLNNIVVALGINQILPVALSAWAIPVAAFVASNAMLLHLEDG